MSLLRRLLELREEGYTAEFISQTLGCQRSTYYTWLKKARALETKFEQQKEETSG